jgi:hypothetical protein
MQVSNQGAEMDLALYARATIVTALEKRFDRLVICVTNSSGPPSNPFVHANPENRRAIDHPGLAGSLL